MAKGDVLDLLLLAFEHRAEVVLARLSVKRGVDGNDVRIGNRPDESSMCDNGCRDENGNGHVWTETSICGDQYDWKAQTEPPGPWKPATCRDERVSNSN